LRGKLFEKTIYLASEHHTGNYPGIVINLVGDRKNFDYLISRIVERHFAHDPNVRVDIRDSNDVHYRVYGLRFLLNHGDMLGVKGGDGIYRRNRPDHAR
jgi:hypothetical protein